MKSLAIALMTILTLTCGLSVANAGDIQNISGNVTIQRQNAQLTPAVGDMLQAQDIIKTGPDGTIGISFADGTRLSLGASSELLLEDYLFAPAENKFAFGVYLVKGTAAYITGQLGKLAPSAVKFSTPQATVGIRGTSFAIKVE